CLGAHANKYGVHVALSVRGNNASGTAIPVTSAESIQFSVAEGCFWGNIFDGTGVYAAANKTMLDSTLSSPRACALESGGVGQCPPMITTGGLCKTACTVQQKGLFLSCT